MEALGVFASVLPEIILTVAGLVLMLVATSEGEGIPRLVSWLTALRSRCLLSMPAA